MYFSPVTQRASHQAGGGWEVSITAVWKAKMQKAASGSAWHLRREKCTSPVPPAGPEVCVLMSKPSEEFWHTLICKHRWANCFTKHVESQSRDGNEHAIIREFVKCYRLKTEATSNHVSHVHSYLTKLRKLCQRRPEALLLWRVIKLRLICKLDFLPPE